MAEPSPHIVSLRWGQIDVAGLGAFKDVKLWPGGGRAWDWRESGTGHRPGIQPADVEELLEHGSEVVVLSQGMAGALGVASRTLDVLFRRGVDVVIERTDEAVASYNRLADEGPVGGLFHSTC